MPTLLLDRPAPSQLSTDPVLLLAFARRGRPLAVSDLIRSMTGSGARLSDLMALLAEALRGGHIRARGHRTDESGAPAGPLLYELTPEGWAIVAADREAL